MSTIFDKICETFSLNPHEAEIFIKTAPERYKLHSISKRHGGVRYIHQPTKNLKFIQRWLVNSYFSSMPIHSCAHAYVKNRNILSNAKPHSHNKYLMKLDFSDFFTSITIRDFLIFAHDNLREFSYEEHHILASLLFALPASLLLPQPAATAITPARPKMAAFFNMDLFMLHPSFET